MKRVLITGQNGMLGRELTAHLTAKGYEVVGATSSQLNLLQTLEAMTKTVAFWAPDVIVHGAAFTDVDGAERNPELAMAINKDGTRKLAIIAQRLGVPLAMVSTDYVFDGLQQRPYQTTDRPNPINTYGLSKYYGELMVTELLEAYYLIRTSWLYGIHGKNFVKFVLDAAREGREIRVIDDQVGSPTWTGTLADQIERIMTSGQYGTYHAADQGEVSRFEQAQAICKAAGLSTEHIRPVSASVFNLPANRPGYSVLNTGSLSVPRWETALEGYLAQYFAHV
jgi:dTDP-4-dehydrorhamnose reductase